MTYDVEPLRRPEGGLADELVRRMEALISERGARGEMRLGSKEELRQAFQVAHGTLNEALRVLESRGLIELRRGPQGGCFVARPSVYVRLSNIFLGFKGTSEETVKDCLWVRDQLEVLITVEAAKAAPSRPQDVARLYELLKSMGDTVHEPQVSLKWNWELHRTICHMGRNKVLAGMYLALLDYVEAELEVVAPASSAERNKKIMEMHREIVDAVASGDPTRAKMAARMHPLPPEEAEPAAASAAQSDRLDGE